MTSGYPPPATRRLITIFIMAAAVMNQIDTTIANVALPHIQGSTSASREQITWVLTSYIVASAIFTPLTGWLASRFGRRRLMLLSIICFTGASVLCGLATHLEELILFRILQGISGSALVPMAQATLLDINPPGEHGKAMAIFGMAAIVGPLLGPLAGGWLTSHYSWRWVFLINLPMGIIAWLGLSALMPESRNEDQSPLDFLGFGLLALSIGALQLMLDRGQILDWFESTEIWIEATVSATCLYLFVVHSLTSAKPFVSLAIFTDRNFVICSLVGFFLGILIYSPMALLPVMLASLMGYPIMQIGMVLAPRGFGVLFSMLVVARLVGKVDFRVMTCLGMLFSAAAMYLMSSMTLEADASLVIGSGILQGIGSSIIFVPLSTMAFTTLATKYRNEATAFNTLMRNFGASVGIALTQVMTIRNEAAVQARLTEGLRPDNPVVQFARPGFDLSLQETVMKLDYEVVRQATMTAYVDTYWALCIVATLVSPLVFILRRPPGPAGGRS